MPMWWTVRADSRWVAESARRLLGCYLNGYPIGAEDGVHGDSIAADHYMLMFYPLMHSDWAVETLFFGFPSLGHWGLVRFRDRPLQRANQILCSLFHRCFLS